MLDVFLPRRARRLRKGFLHAILRARVHKLQQICPILLSPEDHKGYASQQATDEGPVWRQRDVVSVLGHSELDQVRRREGYEMCVGGAANEHRVASCHTRTRSGRLRYPLAFVLRHTRQREKTFGTFSTRMFGANPCGAAPTRP